MLTLAGCLSTLLLFIVHEIWSTAVIFYVDFFVNCVIISLMFEGHGNRLIIPCLKSCFRKTELETKKEKKQKEMTQVTAMNPISMEPPPMAPGIAEGDPQGTLGRTDTMNKKHFDGVDNLGIGHFTHHSQHSSTMPHDIFGGGDKLLASSNDFVYDAIAEGTEEDHPQFTNNFDFGMYLEYWRRGRKNSVIPKHKTLKDELLKNKYAPIAQREYDEVYEGTSMLLTVSHLEYDKMKTFQVFHFDENEARVRCHVTLSCHHLQLVM